MNTAEKQFQEYLDKHKIPFWFINQETQTFSKEIKQLKIKRPDFFILIPNFGYLLVDIKDKTPLKKHKKLCIDYIEAKKYSNLQKLFNMQVWYIISNKDIHYTTWFCIPATKVLQYKKFLVDNTYLSIPLDDYKQISTSQHLYKILQP
ncbi:MAG: hypothetical protein ABIJ18_03195 [archaeon]